ncbi:ubiquitin carboxyl-terminal hydrolase nonstop isoform X2 [Lycorma delicatula]|uniref:ubiquitin carboxyl-terminal hydrolase nonstop isoform X2 n=1 Tax=Lycorma delicatula TaxID=130591 RepID=UPI003F51596B
MSENGCVHLNNFKAAKGVQPYRTIYSFFVTCTTPEARKTKWRYCYCHVCKSIGSRLHSCLHCIFFGCYKGHIQDHAKTKKHYLAVDLACGNVFCFQCGDYIYDTELSQIAREQKDKAASSLGICSKYRKWEPTKEEVELLRKNPRRRQVIQNTTIGLRGLLNLGNTCFMNCIVQALVHTPVLRDYFLAEQHVCQFQDQNHCLVCEVSGLFQEFYSGEKEPLTLHRVLHLIWTNAKHLAGYQQQDAHEFFIAMLNILHRHCKGSIQTPPANNPNRCTCIIDRIFTGGLQSDVVCQSCNGVSTTVDPFRDISLDIGTSNGNNGNSNSNSSSGNSSQSSDSSTTSNNGPVSLIDCLEQFTRPEHLGSATEQKIKCIKCEDYQESTKQFTIQTLPIVACFHLKRFEHSSRFQKISTVIAFPPEIDMTPFMSHHRNGSEESESMCCRGHVSLEDNRYSLFAVVNHEGSFFGGHYTAFIRQQHDQWFKCDDHKITRANIRDVLQSEGVNFIIL